MPREPLLRIRSAVEKRLQRFGAMRPRCLPAFLGIGAQKSGTTWLHARLREHPSIFLPEEKELHYFDWNFHRPLAGYALDFQDAGERLAGEITPGYAILPDDRIDFIARVMPDVRVIYLMRDPVERAWSQVVMNVVEIGGEDPAAIDDASWLRRLGDARVRRRGDHAAVLDAWSRRVPRDRIMVGWFEEIVEAPTELLARIHDFLGVERRRPVGSGVVRPGAGVPMPPGVRAGLVEMLHPELAALADRYEGRCRDWFERWCR